MVLPLSSRFRLPGLGLTLFPNLQHQDGHHAENPAYAPQGTETGSSLQNSPLPDSLLPTLDGERDTKANTSQERSLSVSFSVSDTTVPLLKRLQDNDTKDLCGSTLHEYIPSQSCSSTKVLALTLERTLPKPCTRYTSSSKTPHLSHNVSIPNSLCMWDGASDKVE